MSTSLAEETIRHSVGPDGTVRIRVLSGAVSIRGVAGDEVIAVIRYERLAARDDDGSPMTFRRGERELLIETPSERVVRTGRWGWRLGRETDEEVELDVQVPRGARIEVRSVSADVTVTGTTGEQTYQSTSGDLMLVSTAGDVRVQSVSGDIELRDGALLALRATTTSGDVSAEGTFRSSRVGTVSGDVALRGRFERDGNHAVETVSGDLEVSPDGPITVEASGPAVEIHAEVPHRMESERGRRRVVVGEAGAALSFRSMSGDARVSALRPFAERAEPAESRADVEIDADYDDDDDDEGDQDEPTRRDDTPASPDTGDALPILRALERGEIGIEEASRLLAAVPDHG